MPELKHHDLSTHPYFQDYVRRVVKPSRNVFPAMLDVMLNLFYCMPDNPLKPKDHYDRDEREYIKAQIREFAQGMSSLEVMFGNHPHFRLGYLKETSRNVIRNRQEYESADMSKDDPLFDIIYLHSPANIVMDESQGKEEVQDRVNELFMATMPIGQKVGEGIMQKVGDIPKGSDCLEYIRNIEEYLEAHELSEDERTIVEKYLGIFQATYDASRKDWPDEHKIVGGFVDRLPQNGLLVLGASEMKEVPGLHLVNSYLEASLFQKRLNKS